MAPPPRPRPPGPDGAGPRRVAVRVHPRSARPRVRWDGARLDVWVREPPARGRATAAVVVAAAAALGLPAAAVAVVAGHGGRSKLLEVEGLDPDRLEALREDAEREIG